MYLLFVVALLGLVTSAGAKVYLPCDVGDCASPAPRIQPGWINVPSCGLYEDLKGTAVDVELIQVGNECSCRGYFDENSGGCPSSQCPASGPLGDVEQDFLFGDDTEGSPDGDFILKFYDLVVGAPYKLTSYHCRLDEQPRTARGITVSGATNVSAPGSFRQDHSVFTNPSNTPVTTFTPTSSTVTVRFRAPDDSQVFMNGFILEGGLADVQFELTSSGDLESVSPARLKVLLSDVQDQVVTVDYAVTGGTAVADDDYVLEPGMLTFNPGQMSKDIVIPIVVDTVGEEDETIEVTLSNVTGTNMEIGENATHIYTIIDSRPQVGFATDTVTKQEFESPVEIEVVLSEPSADVVTVDYQITGGTATGGGVDYSALPGGTLTFAPGETSQIISVELVDDGIYERDHDETVELTLSNNINAKMGASEFTLLIIDPWSRVAYPWLKVDLACPGNTTTMKEGWTIFEVPQGCDGQNHDPRDIYDIASSGVNARVGAQDWGGDGNLKQQSGDPICNTFYSSNAPAGRGVQLQFSGAGLVAGEYWAYGYHNGGSGLMPEITATGDGVIQIEPVTDVPLQFIMDDNDLEPSLIKFFTNGSPVTITYYAPTGGNAMINAFELHNTVTPPIASNPNPADGAGDVSPDMVLGWEAGIKAVSHDVYLGTDETAVTNATTASDEYKGSVSQASYDPPGLLDFSQTYYWRIDEVNGVDIWPGEVWRFTADSGKARNPTPVDGGYALTAVFLGWKRGALAISHDVYFGTDETAVANATKASDEYKGNQTATTYNPGTLQETTMYYWRIDEVGASTLVKGDVWSFKATGPIYLKVDLGLPMCSSNPYGGIPGTVVPGTVKDGWWPYVATRWADMYAHDCVWEQDSQAPDGIAGTEVHAMLSCGYEGQGGLHVKGMCRCNLAGDCCPTGVPQGDPIANSWYYAVDWAGPDAGDTVLILTDLPAGKYELKSYHNWWEPGPGQGNRNCCDCVQAGAPPLPSITAQALPPTKPKPGYKGLCLQGDGTGVTPIENAYDVAPTNTFSDDQVATSLIKFSTNGAPVLVIYEAPDWGFPDCARPGREGGRGILNAFELILVGPPPPACWDYPTQCHGDTDDSGDVKGSDFLTLKASWFKCYPEPDYSPCADFDRDGCVKGSDFLIMKSNWYQTVEPDCQSGGTWPPQP